MPMTFRRVETGHYRAESERENMMYNIAQEDGEWVVTCNGEPIGNRYDTYGAARAFANDFEENPIDPALSGPVDPPASEPASLDETEEAELARPTAPSCCPCCPTSAPRRAPSTRRSRASTPTSGSTSRRRSRWSKACAPWASSSPSP
jgi:hypothetical protein